MPRKFNKEFKLNTVKLIPEKNLSIRQASNDLGVGKPTLNRGSGNWKNMTHPKRSQAKVIYMQMMNVTVMERENKILKRERDILKKALTIFLS